MGSILAKQIDFLGGQVQSLPVSDQTVEQIEDAMAVSLSLFDQILTSSQRPSGPTRNALIEQWLRSAEAILPPLRDLKQQGSALSKTAPFMRALLQARAAMANRNQAAASSSKRASLDEVERELQRRAV
jgi:hypothetical protein